MRVRCKVNLDALRSDTRSISFNITFYIKLYHILNIIRQVTTNCILSFSLY